jgi:hypothetical protein
MKAVLQKNRFGILLANLLLCLVPEPKLTAQGGDSGDPNLPAFLKPRNHLGPGEDGPRKLLYDRYHASRREAEARFKVFIAGPSPLGSLAVASRRLLDSEVELCRDLPEEIAIRERYLDLTRKMEMVVKGRFEDGWSPIQDFAEARSFRRDAEIGLLKANKAKTWSK